MAFQNQIENGEIDAAIIQGFGADSDKIETLVGFQASIDGSVFKYKGGTVNGCSGGVIVSTIKIFLWPRLGAILEEGVVVRS